MNNMIELITQLSILAVITEALTQAFKDCIPARLDAMIPTRLISIAIAGGLAVGFGIDLTVLLNNKIDVAGSLLTGVIASRGSNFINDIGSKLMPKKG